MSTTAEEQDVSADTDQLADKPSPVGTTTRWLAFLSVTCILIGNYFLLLSAPPRTPTPHQPPAEQTLSLSPPWPPPPSPSLPTVSTTSAAAHACQAGTHAAHAAASECGDDQRPLPAQPYDPSLWSRGDGRADASVLLHLLDGWEKFMRRLLARL